MQKLTQPQIASLDEYRRRFTDVEFWRAFVEAVCARHSLSPVAAIAAGFPGTNPVFLVEQRYVVKFYTEFFNGELSYAVEREVYRLLGARPDLSVPALVAAGALLPEATGWRWPYLITTLLPGQSLTAAAEQVSAVDRRRLARELGPLLRAIHSLPLEQSGLLSPDWRPFLAFLASQRDGCSERHRRWGSLPPHLVEQIDSYLPPLDRLVDRSVSPALLHCDLNADHVLGVIEPGGWRTTGVIDFGDSRVGDPAYELPVLQFGLFGGDRSLLRAFLDAYGSPSLRHDLPRCALSYTLLHEYDLLKSLRATLWDVSRLDELALLLWDVEQPAL